MADIQYSVTWGADPPSPPSPETTQDLMSVENRAWFPASTAPLAMNYWQMGMPRENPSIHTAAAVYACRKVLSEEVSRLPAHHYRVEGDGGRTLISGSNLARILVTPNAFQSGVTFWLNQMDRTLTEGNSYAYAERDERGAISALIPIRQASPMVDPETGRVFYGLGYDLNTPRESNDMNPGLIVPARNVLHLRLFTPVHPLIGETPLVAAALAAGTGLAVSNSSFSFFNSAARPSGYLRHPKKIQKETRDRLKEQWEHLHSGANTGRTAVLEEGLDWVPLSMNAVDSEVVEQYKLTVEDVARVFRVPLFMLGNMDKATFSNVEQMTRSFYAGGLGFYIALIEAELKRFFDLPMNEIARFDVEGGLLRTEFRDRIEGLVRGTQGGVYAVNEARRREGLPEVASGDEPLVQQQMVPLSYAATQTNEPASAPPTAPPPEITEESIRAGVRRALGMAA